MAKQLIRRVLTVFLASPGDVVEERQIAKKVVEQVNRVVRPELRWEIELLGWEDTLPSFGRPQQIINRDIVVKVRRMPPQWALPG